MSETNKESDYTISTMKIEEAREIGRLCANLEPGYPPTNLIVILRAALTLYRSAESEDRDLVPSIMRWGAGQA
jgi:hypothetical protein